MALFTGQREEVMESLLQLNVCETTLYVMPLTVLVLESV